jgi:WhiB family redox-sensing transcriptional regulator
MLLLRASRTLGEARLLSVLATGAGGFNHRRNDSMALTFQSPPDWSADERWRTQAVCGDIDPDLFFPVGVTGPAVEQIATAKAVCAGCTVRAECLEFAISTNQEYGVWGGTSEEERRVLRRAWRAQQRRAAS